MQELFKTVLVLSLSGTAVTAILLLFKPITAKKLSAKWQYCLWLAALLSMLIPAYKLIPQKEAQKLSEFSQTTVQTTDESIVSARTPIEYREVNVFQKAGIRLPDLAARIWLFGMSVYLLAVISSYVFYLIRKRGRSVSITECEEFCAAKKELAVKRRIKIRRAEDSESPMLVGVLFPCVYVPKCEFSRENMRMIFLHELTHYKHHDLLVKWLAVFVNAVHWFNPFAYLMRKSIGEACEIFCDMSVTENMSEEEQRTYMKTILDLVE